MRIRSSRLFNPVILNTTEDCTSRPLTQALRVFTLVLYDQYINEVLLSSRQNCIGLIRRRTRSQKSQKYVSTAEVFFCLSVNSLRVCCLPSLATLMLCCTFSSLRFGFLSISCMQIQSND